ncbi:MAG: MBL fold metallo-hydrolase [Candidatus Cloacimonetes bacterium]|nr:MBL fold metallo-hydrolase [Candidatus Cloacimonadota bacterium]
MRKTMQEQLVPEVKELAPGVFSMTGLYNHDHDEGVNAGFIITSGSIIFIDAGMSSYSAKALWREAQSRVHGEKEIYLVLTHHHPDHSFGMGYFVQHGAHVIAHRETSKLFHHEGDKYRDFIIERYFHDPLKAAEVLGEVRLTPPRTSIAQDEVMIVDEEEIHLLHVPGHVMGQLCVYHPESRVLFGSDAIYSGRPPDTQYSRPGGWKMWIGQLQRLKDLPLDTIVPGHGPLGDAEIITDNIIYLRLALGRQNRQLYHVLKHKKYGKVLELSLHNDRSALFLARQGFVVTGLDTDKETGERWVEEARRENLRVHFQNIDAYEYTFDDRFDIIIATNIFHRHTPDENEELLQRMHSYTQPRGIHILTAFTSETPTSGATGLFAPGQLRELYANWQILHYEEGYTHIHTDDDDPEPHRHSVAVLVAQQN